MAKHFSLPNKIKLEISGWCSPSVWGHLQNLGFLDLALQKKILKDKVNVRLALSDVFLHFTLVWKQQPFLRFVYCW
jgi:hypothetical protein